MAHKLPIQINKGSGDTIVLIHGLGNNYRSWTYVLENINFKKNKVIAIDLLGFGDADKPRNCQYTVSDHAVAVIETLDSLQIKGAVISGHSMGCLVATEVARQRPDLAKKLVLLGAPLFKKMPGKYSRFRFWKTEDVYSKLFRLISTQKDMTLTAANGVVQFLPLIKGMEITKETWPAFKKSLRNTIMQTKSYFDLIDIRIPTHLIYGHLDLFVIKKNLKTIARKNKQFVTYDAGLGPHEITPINGKSVAELLQESS